MSSLQNRTNRISGNGAAPLVGIKNNCLKGFLTKSLRCQPGITVDGALPAPRRSQVDLACSPEQAFHQITKVTGFRIGGEIVSLALNYVRGEVRRLTGWCVKRKITSVTQKNRSYYRILLR